MKVGDFTMDDNNPTRYMCSRFCGSSPRRAPSHTSASEMTSTPAEWVRREKEGGGRGITGRGSTPHCAWEPSYTVHAQGK